MISLNAMVYLSIGIQKLSYKFCPLSLLSILKSCWYKTQIKKRKAFCGDSIEIFMTSKHVKFF